MVSTRRDGDENVHCGGMEQELAAGCGIEKAYFGPSIIANHADEIFFPNVRELLKDGA